MGFSLWKYISAYYCLAVALCYIYFYLWSLQMIAQIAGCRE